MDEIKKLKDRVSKINELLDKLDEKLVHGDITEAKYQELSDKYKAEGDSLKNQIVETELLQEVGLNEEEKTEAVESPKPEKKEILQEVEFKAEREEVIEPPKVITEEIRHVSSEGGLFSSFLWMMVLSPFLFWIPLLGPFIVGFIGGKKAGSTEKAVLAGLIPILLMMLMYLGLFENNNDSDFIIASWFLILILVPIGSYMGQQAIKNEDANKTLSAFFYMMVLSIFLFWVPFLGSFIVGFVGGKKTGNTKNAILAGIIPIILIITISVEVFGEYSSSFYTDNGVIIASVLLSPIIVVIGAIMGSRTNKQEA